MEDQTTAAEIFLRRKGRSGHLRNETGSTPFARQMPPSSPRLPDLRHRALIVPRLNISFHRLASDDIASLDILSDSRSTGARFHHDVRPRPDQQLLIDPQIKRAL